MTTSTHGDCLRLFVTKWINEKPIQPHDIERLHEMAELLDSYYHFHRRAMVFLGLQPAEPSPGLGWNLYEEGKRIQLMVSALGKEVLK